MAEQEGVFEELNQEEYDERQMARREDDFIVDDEGFGYKDKGGEIWEVGESATNEASKKRKRKLNVSLVNRLEDFAMMYLAPNVLTLVDFSL